MKTTDCPFCQMDPGLVLGRTSGFFAIQDRYPLTPGHTLIIPNRHVPDWFDLTATEQECALELLRQMRTRLGHERNPSGYNIGVNIGAAAGQTVFHAHVHLIPRYAGDVEDPRGGVRHVIPDRARYWREPPR